MEWLTNAKMWVDIHSSINNFYRGYLKQQWSLNFQKEASPIEISFYTLSDKLELEFSKFHKENCIKFHISKDWVNWTFSNGIVTLKTCDTEFCKLKFTVYTWSKTYWTTWPWYPKMNRQMHFERPNPYVNTLTSFRYNFYGTH